MPGSMFWRACIYIQSSRRGSRELGVFLHFCVQGGVMNGLAGLFVGHTVSVDWTAQTWTANGSYAPEHLERCWLVVIIFLAALDAFLANSSSRLASTGE